MRRTPESQTTTSNRGSSPAHRYCTQLSGIVHLSRFWTNWRKEIDQLIKQFRPRVRTQGSYEPFVMGNVISDDIAISGGESCTTKRRPKFGIGDSFGQATGDGNKHLFRAISPILRKPISSRLNLDQVPSSMSCRTVCEPRSRPSSTSKAGIYELRSVSRVHAVSQSCTRSTSSTCTALRARMRQHYIVDKIVNYPSYPAKGFRPR